MSVLSRLPGVASAAAVVFGAFAHAATPNIARNVPQWAEEDRYVASESGSSRPGKWLNATAPLAIEPMECVSADHPARTVTLKLAAQLFKTEVGLNWIGQTICDDPASVMLVLPSLDELRAWNGTKWQPTVDATPALKARVLATVERSRTGSTTAFKRFRRGYLMVTTASSSKGLQGRSIKRLICDEVSEFPIDAGGRGDPLKQAMRRGDAHDDFKALLTSTPKEQPACRITALYEAGDQRRYYVQCPHCGENQVLALAALQAPAQAGGRASFGCLECGVLIDEVHKSAMIGDGRRWIKTYPSLDPANPAPPEHFPAAEFARWRARGSEGREPSFAAWQAYSKLRSWTAIWNDHQAALADVQSGRDPDALKVFTQQVEGEAYDAATDAPDHDKLFEVRGKFVTRGLIPAWACETMLAADVQGDRIEWDAYAIGPDLSMARFDWGVVEHDPLHAAAWAELAEVIARRYPGEATVDLGFDIVGVDSGGKKGVTERVYRFVRARPNVLALKGAKDPDAVPLTKGKRHNYRLEDNTYITAETWNVGGWGLKFTIYSMLETSREAVDDRLPGGHYKPPDAPIEDFKKYVAEVYRKTKSKRAGARGWWDRIPGQANERLDTAVYARALAWRRGAFTRTPAEWQALFQARAKAPGAELPLFKAAETQMPTPVAEPAANPGAGRVSWFADRSKV